MSSENKITQSYLLRYIDMINIFAKSKCLYKSFKLQAKILSL